MSEPITIYDEMAWFAAGLAPFGKRVGEVDFERVRDITEKIIAVKGADYVDPNSGDEADLQCQYFELDTETPSCLVGHVLHELGMRIEDLYGHTDSIEELNACASMRHLMSILAVPVSGAAAQYMHKLQDFNDGGLPWGDCAEGADHYVRYGDDE